MVGLDQAQGLFGLAVAKGGTVFGVLTNPPLVGAVWDPAIEHPSFLPGTTLDLLGLSFAAVNTPSPFGTLLCSAPVLFLGAPGSPFAVAIPRHCNLSGLQIYAQGAATDGVVLRVTNGIDAIVGSF